MPWDYAARLCVALLLGVVIGAERQWHQGNAGLRTNALVAVGSSAFVSLPGLLSEDGTGPAHMTQYVISGIGFLGAGAIMREGATVRGLNTAATLWATGAVGSFVGSGRPQHAMVVAAAILVVNFCMRPLVTLIDRLSSALGHGVPASYLVEIVVLTPTEAPMRAKLVEALRHRHLSMRGLDTGPDVDGRVTVKADVATTGGKDPVIEAVVALFARKDGVESARWSRQDSMDNDPKLHPSS